MIKDNPECPTSNCKWIKRPDPDDDLDCVEGMPSNCGMAVILQAEESNFHDANLVTATAAIKQILENIPPDPQGRKLSFLRTNLGVLLAWVNHGSTNSSGGITAEDDDQTVISALGLIV